MPSDDRSEEPLPGQRGGQRRLRLDIAVGAVLLGAAFLIARAASGGGSSPSPGQSGTPTHATTAAPPVVRVQPSGSPTPFVTVSRVGGGWLPEQPLPRRTSADPRSCPPQHSCRLVRTVPDALRAAVHATFRNARIREVESVALTGGPARPRLWFRKVSADLGAGRLVVWLAAPAANGREPPGPSSATVVRAVLGQYAETLWIAPQQEGVLYRLLHLAQDARLLDAG